MRKIAWYKTLLNFVASLVLVLLWKTAAWLMSFFPGIHSTQDELFMFLVAMTVALNICGDVSLDIPKCRGQYERP